MSAPAVVEGEVKSTKVAMRKDAAEPVVVNEGDALLAMIERAARDPSVDIDKMERLFAMRERMSAQQAKAAFLADLAKLQAVLPAVERKGTGHNQKKYARFEDFIEAIKPHLAAHGFSLTFRTAQSDTHVKVTGVLGHQAGHQESTDLSLPADTTGNKNAVQSWGSSTSYGKRYVGLTLLGIATEDEDDDGKAAGEGEMITEMQADAIRADLDGLNADIAKFCEHIGVDGIAKISVSKYARALEAIALKRRKAGK